MDRLSDEAIQELIKQIFNREDVTNVQIESTEDFVKVNGTITSEAGEVHGTILYLPRSQPTKKIVEDWIASQD